MKRITISLPDEVYKKVREEAFNTYTSMSNIIVGKITGTTILRVRGIIKGVPEIDEKFLDTKPGTVIPKLRGELDADNYT